jgi:Xaa-Pro aminopeptidase
MVDGVYHDIYEALKPGVRENPTSSRWPPSGCSRWAPSRSRPSTRSPASAAARTRTCSPTAHPPGRPGLLRHHPRLQRLPHLLLPDVRGRPGDPGAPGRLQQGRELIDAAIEMVKPGVGTDEIARLWPDADRVRVLLRDGGVRPAVRSRPRARAPRTAVISKLNSLEHPVEIKEGMVFALETFWPADDGHSAARIEEEVVVTADGASC